MKILSQLHWTFKYFKRHATEEILHPLTDVMSKKIIKDKKFNVRIDKREEVHNIVANLPANTCTWQR